MIVLTVGINTYSTVPVIRAAHVERTAHVAIQTVSSTKCRRIAYAYLVSFLTNCDGMGRGAHTVGSAVASPTIRRPIATAPVDVAAAPIRAGARGTALSLIGCRLAL
jgi:hypothetical protein